jgi:hypothetical protein
MIEHPKRVILIMILVTSAIKSTSAMQFTQLGNLDFCADKATCGHGGYGEAGLHLFKKKV